MKKLFWLILALGLGACASPIRQTTGVDIPTKTPLPADTPTQISTVGDIATLTLAPTLTPTPTPTVTLTASPESLAVVVLGLAAGCGKQDVPATDAAMAPAPVETPEAATAATVPTTSGALALMAYDASAAPPGCR